MSKIIGYTTGVYDMFHIGHLNILKRAKAQCDYLIVGVTTDELCFSRKNKYPIINQDERLQIIESIKYVDKAVFQDTMDGLEVTTSYVQEIKKYILKHLVILLVLSLLHFMMKIKISLVLSIQT